MRPEAQPSLRRRALSLATLVLFCAVVCIHCSDEPSVDVSTQCLEFLPDAGTASGHVISRTGAESTCNFLDIELVATAVLEEINSVEIQISYANALAVLNLVEVGPLLTESGDEFVACAQSLSEYGVFCELRDDFENATVDISLSRTEIPATGVDAPAEGAVLARLTFIQITTLPGANGPFQFNFGKLIDDGDGGTTTPTNIIDVAVDPSTFVGGQMIIQQR